MANLWRRAFGAIGIVVLIVVIYSIVYQWGMATFEGRDVPFYVAVQIVVESLTTAGFGGHAPWSSIQMNMFVLWMNLTGVVMVFLGLPAFAVPLIQRAVSSPPPTTSDLSDHVIIGSYSHLDDVLQDELTGADVPYVFLESDGEVVRELVDDGKSAIHGNPEEVKAMESANIDEAKAVVADVDDETNPTVILSADRANPDVEILSVARDPDVAPYHRYAGADTVVQARQMLGESLALRSMKSLTEEMRDVIDVETELEVTEVLIEDGSELEGKTLGDADIFDRSEITVIGGWFNGKFIVSPPPNEKLRENTILLIAGRHDDLNELTARKLPDHTDDPEHIVVCGHGSVGGVVADTIDTAGFDMDVVDLVEENGVDVVGDVTEPETLIRANIQESRAVVLSLDDDKTAIYATVMINKLAPDVEIIARANDAENIWKLYNAGADYVLSLPTVTGEVLASELIDDRDILTPHMEFDFTRVENHGMGGKSLVELDIRNKTGCTIVAVERDGDLVTDVGAEFVIEDDDVLIAAGSNDSLDCLANFCN